MKTMQTVGVALITHNAAHHLRHCIPPILASGAADRFIVVNSSSNDGTVEAAQRLGAETLVVPRAHFNHGATREFARKSLGTDIAVMMTPDAYPLDSGFLAKLVDPLRSGVAAVSYARQVGHDGADFFEDFPRQFNYPPVSHVRGVAEIDEYGSFLFFCSNSCAAWSNAALDEVGGFPTVLTNEDTFAVSLLLKRGHKISYVADAVVRHSHRYSLLQEFRRYADTGYAREQFKFLRDFSVRDEGHGAKFVRAMLRAAWQRSALLVPYAITNIAVKYAGFKVGQLLAHQGGVLMPYISSQDFFWRGIHAPGQRGAAER